MRGKHYGRRQLHRERCRLAPGDERPAENVVPVGESLRGIIARAGLARDVWISRFAETWEEMAGAVVAGHTRPGTLERGVLTVFVDSTSWRHELMRFAGSELHRNVQARHPEANVREVRFILDPDLRG